MERSSKDEINNEVMLPVKERS